MEGYKGTPAESLRKGSFKTNMFNKRENKMNEKRFPKKGNGRKSPKWKTSIKMGKLVWKCHTGRGHNNMKISCAGERRLKERQLN
jgi:hypothetical protein